MTEKVKLPKEVCDALDEAIKNNYADYEIIFYCGNKDFGRVFSALNKVDYKLILKALLFGYEPELSAEEQLKQYFQSTLLASNGTYRGGVIDALRIHGIRYDWMSDADERPLD